MQSSAAQHNPNKQSGDGRATLSIDEIISEDEARRRREQLNRRPSYRMILKDLETVGDKPLKKEAEDGSSQPDPHMGGNPQHQQQSSSVSSGMSGGMTPIDRNSSPYGSPMSNGSNLVGRSPGGSGMLAPSAGGNRPPMIAPPLPQSQQLQQQPPPRMMNSEIPSQPQPQQLPPTSSVMSPLISAVAAAAAAANSGGLVLPTTSEIISLKAAEALNQGVGVIGGYAQNNDWQSNLLSSYSQNNSLVGAPPMGLDGFDGRTRQGSASLTSLSDNDDSTRKRQVRLLKNREAAKECRRKKKEYVKCLENRVAVLENQNKALIEELKTLKELYCRKEKSELT